MFIFVLNIYLQCISIYLTTYQGPKWALVFFKEDITALRNTPAHFQTPGEENSKEPGSCGQHTACQEAGVSQELVSPGHKVCTHKSAVIYSKIVGVEGLMTQMSEVGDFREQHGLKSELKKVK